MNPNSHDVSLLLASRQGEKAMKHNTSVWRLAIVCATLLAIILLTRERLYELRYLTGEKEVTALLACKP